MSETALTYIHEAKEKRLTTLDISNCGLTELPDEVFELTWLETLILSSCWNEYDLETNQWKHCITQNEGDINRIKKLPPNLKLLRGLKKLVLREEYIDSRGHVVGDDLNPLAHLTQLQILEITVNIVVDLSPLRHLTQLKILDLNVCQVVDLSPLQYLTQLQILNITSFFTTDFSSLIYLTNLQKLNIAYTSISDLSPLRQLK